MKGPTKKLTINLAVESIESLKQKASKLKNIECHREYIDPCKKRLQLVPAPVRKIKKKQIEICKCPTVQFVCPPVPCVCPPCPICPTPAERLKHLLKTGLKLGILYALIRWTMAQELWGTAEHTSKLTNYYTSIVNSLLYGEEESVRRSLALPPGFFDIRRAVYQIQLTWNKLIATFFYATVGLPVNLLNRIKNAFNPNIQNNVEYDNDDEKTEQL